MIQPLAQAEPRFLARALRLRTSLAGLALAFVACSSKAPISERGVQLDPDRVRTRAAPPPEEKPEPAPQPARPGGRKLKSPFELGPGDLMADPNAAKPEPEPEPAAGEERDLGRELSDMLAGPGCFDLAAAAKQPGGRLTISASAYVTGTGRITRATVSAAGQPPTALRCAESKLVSQGMKGPIPGGPQSVSGSSTLEVAVAEPPKTATPASPQPTPRPPAPGGYAQPPDKGKAPEMAGRSSNYGLEHGDPDEMAGAP
jgi:hypothetical protein